VRRHDDRGTGPFPPQERGRQVDRVERPELGGHRLGGPGEDRWRDVDDLGPLEEPEDRFPFARIFSRPAAEAADVPPDPAE
jgi:hypothetical protein